MVFSSIPAYLDPANWQQQLNHQIGGSSGSNSHPQLQPPPPPPPQQLQQQPPPPLPHGSGGPSSIRPGSMSDRARMANIPMPEAALKCPRCESTNTKFCYFNNYSLSQPRHFCKTCRRYWTRGGALRNVPVGGGCRRNKRSKGSSNNSKSPASSGDRQAAPSGSGTSSMNPSNSTNSGISANILGLTSQIPQLRFMSPLSQLTHDFGSSDIGLNYGGNSAPAVATSEMSYHIGSNLFGGSGGGAGGGSASILYPFQGQQFPFLGGLDQSGQGLFSYQGGGGGGGEPSGYVGAKLSNSMLSQLASVKMEDHNINNLDQSNNLARQFMGVNPGNNDQWSGSAWTDLSGFSSSSTSNPL